MLRFLAILLGSVVVLGAQQSDRADASLNEGHSYAVQQDYERARKAYQRALSSSVPVIRSLAQLALAQSYLMEGKLDEAKAEYRKLPADALAHHKFEAEQQLRAIERQQNGLPARDPAALRVKVPALPTPALTLHVAVNGADTNDGSASKPFATLARARDEVRARKRAGVAGPIEVLVHGGDYDIRATVRMGPEDSGTAAAPIVYRAAPGEKPVFRGGMRLSGFDPVSDAKLRQRLPSAARGKVMQVKLGPGVEILPLKYGGFGAAGGFTTFAHELFFNGKAMQLARGPNSGFLRVKDVAVKDGTKTYDRQGSKVGKIVYNGDELARWQGEPDLMLYGYWFFDSIDSYERVAGIDVPGRVISLREPYHQYGYRVGAPFYAINALCELDEPGEWYLDRASRTVLFYPPGPMEGASVELSLLSQRLMELENVQNVRFEGLTWELGSADAIMIHGGNNCLVVGCTVRRCAGNGIHVWGGTNHRVISSDVYSMGKGGVILNGGDRRTLSAANHLVENCDIFELSRIDHTYTPAVTLEGVGNRAAYNRLHDLYSSAVRVAGNDHILEYSEIFNAVQESDDQGAADMYFNPTYRGNIFRFNDWHHIGNQGSGEAPRGGQAAIRLDDAISGVLIYGNIFERTAAGQIGFGGIQIHGGKDNIIDNNIFYGCTSAISFSAWDDARWRNAAVTALGSPEINKTLYFQRYPELAQLAENANHNYILRSRMMETPEFIRRPTPRAEVYDGPGPGKGDPFSSAPGFYPIPYEEIGVYRDAYRTSFR